MLFLANTVLPLFGNVSVACVVLHVTVPPSVFVVVKSAEVRALLAAALNIATTCCIALIIYINYVRPVQLIIHRVDVIFIAVATPFAASVLEPVVPVHASTIVSDVIAMVITPADVSLINVIAVPIGYATLAFESIVHVRAVVSAPGW